MSTGSAVWKQRAVNENKKLQNFRKKFHKFYINLTYNPQNITTFELVAICDILLGSLDMQGNSKKSIMQRGSHTLLYEEIKTNLTVN